MSSKHKVEDFLGAELSVGDVIVYAVSRRSSAAMRLGVIREIGPSGSQGAIKIKIFNSDGAKVTLDYSKRCVRIDPSALLVSDSGAAIVAMKRLTLLPYANGVDVP